MGVTGQAPTTYLGRDFDVNGGRGIRGDQIMLEKQHLAADTQSTATWSDGQDHPDLGQYKQISIANWFETIHPYSAPLQVAENTIKPQQWIEGIGNIPIVANVGEITTGAITAGDDVEPGFYRLVVTTAGTTGARFRIAAPDGDKVQDDIAPGAVSNTHISIANLAVTTAVALGDEWIIPYYSGQWIWVKHSNSIWVKKSTGVLATDIAPASTGNSHWALMVDGTDGVSGFGIGGGDFKGTWDSETSYSRGNVVIDNGTLCILAAGNSTGQAPRLDPAIWIRIRNDAAPYNANTTYRLGEHVSQHGKLYACRVASSTGTDPSSTGQTDWIEIAAQTSGPEGILSRTQEAIADDEEVSISVGADEWLISASSVPAPTAGRFDARVRFEFKQTSESTYQVEWMTVSELAALPASDTFNTSRAKRVYQASGDFDIWVFKRANGSLYFRKVGGSGSSDIDFVMDQFYFSESMDRVQEALIEMVGAANIHRLEQTSGFDSIDGDNAGEEVTLAIPQRLLDDHARFGAELRVEAYVFATSATGSGAILDIKNGTTVLGSSGSVGVGSNGAGLSAECIAPDGVTSLTLRVSRSPGSAGAVDISRLNAAVFPIYVHPDVEVRSGTADPASANTASNLNTLYIKRGASDGSGWEFHFSASGGTTWVELDLGGSGPGTLTPFERSGGFTRSYSELKAAGNISIGSSTHRLEIALPSPVSGADDDSLYLTLTDTADNADYSQYVSVAALNALDNSGTYSADEAIRLVDAGGRTLDLWVGSDSTLLLLGTGGARTYNLRIEQESVTGFSEVLRRAIRNFALADGSVTEAKLADGSVTLAKLAANSVNAGKIQANAVGSSELKNDAVETGHVKDAQITEAKLADGAVVESKLGDGSATTGKIADGAVAEAKLADNSVANSKIKDLAVTLAKLGASVVTRLLPVTTPATAQRPLVSTGSGNPSWQQLTKDGIADDAVETSKLKDGAVTSAKLASGILQVPGGGSAYQVLQRQTGGGSGYSWGFILAGSIASGAVTLGKLASDVTARLVAATGNTGHALLKTATGSAFGQLTSLGIANNAITSSKISDGAVTEAKLASNSVGSAKIKTNAVGASELANNAVDTAAIADDAVTGAKIPDDAITAAHIVDGVIPNDPGGSREFILFRRTTLNPPPDPTYTTFGGPGVGLGGGSANGWSFAVPAGSDPLWLTHAVGHRPGGTSSWGIDNWHTFLNDHPDDTTFTARYSASADGPWSATPRSDGFMRFREDDGTWHGPVPIGSQALEVQYSATESGTYSASVRTNGYVRFRSPGTSTWLGPFAIGTAADPTSTFETEFSASGTGGWITTDVGQAYIRYRPSSSDSWIGPLRRGVPAATIPDWTPIFSSSLTVTGSGASKATSQGFNLDYYADILFQFSKNSNLGDNYVAEKSVRADLMSVLNSTESTGNIWLYGSPTEGLRMSRSAIAASAPGSDDTCMRISLQRAAGQTSGRIVTNVEVHAFAGRSLSLEIYVR